MSGTFPHEMKFVNGLSGDPALHVFFPMSGDAMLFDLGTLDALSNRELLKVRHAFVSHCHIDHFIGFDRLLRVNIPHFRSVSVAGPEGFIANVRGRLHGYLWNLLEKDQIVFDVTEVLADGSLKQATISSTHGFEPSDVRTVSGVGGIAKVAQIADGGEVRAVVLDHGTPSVAYRFESPRRMHVRSEVLASLGYQPGPWIKELQTAASRQRFDAMIEVAGQKHRAGDLTKTLLSEVPSFSLGYLTDIVFSEKNLARLKALFTPTTVLVCEASFRDADALRAQQKLHLSTRQAALIAAVCQVEDLRVFHVSGIYGEDTQVSVEEAARYFAEYRAMTPEDLEAAIASEIRRVS